MAGTKAGGRKAAEKNMARDPDFYKRIGAKGGRNGNTGGFVSAFHYCKALPGYHKVAVCAGARGGRISRKNKVV